MDNGVQVDRIKVVTESIRVTITLSEEQAAYLSLLFYKHLPAGANNHVLGNIYAMMKDQRVPYAKSLFLDGRP